ncbi:hypothetical protein CIL03_01685 [Virgibacillus indicus]|uniref:Uncharacterized protein n=1 Tax=Virgibacillus indicus TaxID=2024554 RepID=A0A265NDI4_9BACI|nr:zinc-ribbon domain-containing protein [Virgibacillus indicus]OZU89877.1 hypothetical protein CIL03_01685 [Virgibacillus indicus]
MKCSNCGKENKKQNQFCSECGAQLSSQRHFPAKKKPGKKVIALTGAIILLLAGAITFYFVGKARFTPENTIETFEQAVKNNNPDEIHSLLTSSDESLSINAQSAANLIEFLSDNPDIFKNLLGKLNDQGGYLNAYGTAQGTQGNHGTLNLKKGEKKWLFFDEYKLEVVPIYITLFTQNDGIDLSINGENVASSSGENYEETFGPYMPGTHVVGASYQNSYTNTETEDEINAFETGEDTIRHEIGLPLTEVTIESDYDEYRLLVNGEETDIIINEGDNLIGKFPEDSSDTVQIHKEFPWGSIKSEEKTVSSGSVEFDDIDVFQEVEKIALMERLNEIFISYIDSLTKRDTSVLHEGATDNIKKDLEEHLEFTSDWDSPYEGRLVKAEYDNSKITFPEYDENLKGYTITLRVHYILHEPEGHAFGNLSWLLRDEEKQQYTASKGLTLLYDEKESAWKLHKIENEYFHLSTRNKQEFTFDN